MKDPDTSNLGPQFSEATYNFMERLLAHGIPPANTILALVVLARCPEEVYADVRREGMTGEALLGILPGIIEVLDKNQQAAARQAWVVNKTAENWAEKPGKKGKQGKQVKNTRLP